MGHGSDRPAAALLLVDVINDLEFDGGDELLEHALPMADRVARLKDRARAAGLPTVYVNDNFGRWRSDFRATVDRVLGGDVRGRELARRLRPEDDDYFVLKPRHSGFFSTSLDVLLLDLGVHALVVTGIQTDNCVDATATDGYVRGYRVVVPEDGCASERLGFHRAALDRMRRVLKAETPPCAEVDLDELARHRGRTLAGAGS